MPMGIIIILLVVKSNLGFWSYGYEQGQKNKPNKKEDRRA